MSAKLFLRQAQALDRLRLFGILSLQFKSKNQTRVWEQRQKQISDGDFGHKTTLINLTNHNQTTL